MQIKEAKIFQFGKLQNKNIIFEPGINVIYGKNETGKSTLHSFLNAMLFGMEKSRGRAAATDIYQQYEPWHASSFYAGALKFTVGQQKFYLERNFYSKEKSDYLRNELDGEELSVGFGDLTMLLGGVSKESYANTYDISQAGATTGSQMIKILSEYLTKASDGSDSGVTVAEATASLAARRRELLQEQKKAAEEREAQLETLTLKKNLLEQECEEIRISIAKYEASGNAKNPMEPEKNSAMADNQSEIHQDVKEDIAQKDGKIKNANSDFSEKSGYFISGIAVIIAIVLFCLKVYITPMIFGIGEAAAVVLALFFAIRQYERNKYHAMSQKTSLQLKRQSELNNQENAEAQIQHSRQLADCMLAEWKESLQEKENRLFNLAEELEKLSVCSETERERAQDIQALELAAEEITRISKAFYEDMEDELNAEISRYVSLFTAGAYDSVRLDEQGQLQILTQGKEVRPQLLSRGTLEQIYLALRIAVGKVVTREEPLPILLDEAFAMYDDERLEQTLRALSGFENQIFIFTCQKREAELLSKMNIEYHLIRL